MKDGVSGTKWYQNKKFLAGIAVLILVCLCIVYLLSSQQTIKVQAQEIELGDAVSLSKESLLDTKHMDSDVVKDIKISSDLMSDEEKYTYNAETNEVVSKNKQYLEPGTYTVTLTYGDETQEAKITIQDTKSPEFVGFRKTITVEQNAEGFDLTRYYLAEDKSDVSVKTEEKTDISKATTVKNIIVGEDEFENESKKECEVKVVTQEDIKNGTKLTPMVDGNVPLSKDTFEKAKSGEIDVQVEDLNKELKTAYADIQEDKINGTTSFKETENADQYFNRDKFTNEGGISMEALGMTYKEYREFLNENFVDPETGTMKGTYNPETNAMEWQEHADSVANANKGNGSSFSQPSGGNTSQSGNSSSGDNTSSGGTTTPSQPVEPETPACDNTIPAGFFATKAEADAYGQKLVMDALLNGNANSGGYYVDIYTNACGTKYYGVTLKPFQ